MIFDMLLSKIEDLIEFRLLMHSFYTPIHNHIAV